MNVLSAGEIIVGMYIAVYEIKYPHRYICPMSGAPKEELLVDRHPFVKGQPFKVIDVNGPIIAVDTKGIFPNLPRVCFFDSRFHLFLLTTKTFHDKYYRLMRVNAPIGAMHVIGGSRADE